MKAKRNVFCFSRKRDSKSCSSSTSFDTRQPKEEDEPTKLNKPLQKKHRFVRRPLNSKQFRYVAKKTVRVLLWVRRCTKSFPRRPEAKKASKKEGIGHDLTTPSLSARGLSRTRRTSPAFRFSCLSLRAKPPTKITRLGGGERSAIEWVATQDEAASHGHDERRHGRTIDPHTTPCCLLRISEAAEKSLKTSSLLLTFPSNKTSWEIICEAEDLSKYAYSILDCILKEVGDELGIDNLSSSIESDEVPYTIDREADELCLSLCNSFEGMSTAASEFCLHAISMIVNCLEEYLPVKDCATALLFQAALECVNTYRRIDRVQERMIIKRRGKLAVIDWSKEKEESRVPHFWKLLEAVSGCVIIVQNRVLQSALMEFPDNGTDKGDASKLESHLQQSWTWMNKISKRVYVLCQSRKRVMFVYLLERFTEATGELAQYQKLLPMLNDAHCKERLASAASFCQRMLLQSVMQLFERAEQAGLQFNKEGLVSARDFAQIADASQMYFVTLTFLFSAVAEQRGNTVSQSQHFNETLKKYGAELMYFAQPCVEVIGVLARKGAARTSTPNENAGDIVEGQDNVALELPASVKLSASLVQKTELPKAAHLDNKKQVQEPLNSAGATRSPRLPCPRVVTRIAKRANRTPFARPENVPVIETPNDVLEAENVAAPTTNVVSDLFELPSERAEESLDRILLPMSSTGHCNRVNVKTMTIVKSLGRGSSGQVSLVSFDNNHAALKESTCPNLSKARHRLERESIVHEKINSCINIVRFLGRAIEKDQSGKVQTVGIVTEWCDLSDLDTALAEAIWVQELDLDGKDISFMKGKIGYRLYKDWVKRLEVVVSIAAGMVYMHKHYIVHRDLTTQNIFLSSAGNSGEFGIKIGDFERAYYLPNGEPIQRTKAPANSAPWMGPEVLKHEKYGLKADLYSIGTILWQLMYLENPWTHLGRRCFGADNVAIQYFLSAGKVNLSISEDDVPEGVPEFPELVQLVKRAWASNPDNRPTMAEFHEEVKAICIRMKERVFDQGKQK